MSPKTKRILTVFFTVSIAAVIVAGLYILTDFLWPGTRVFSDRDKKFLEKVKSTGRLDDLMSCLESNPQSPSVGTEIKDDEENHAPEVDEVLLYDHKKQIYNKYYHPTKSNSGVNCDSIANGDIQAMEDGKQFSLNNPRIAVPMETYTNIQNCQDFKMERGYIEDPLSKEEENFPLAFSILTYKDVEQVDRLLKAIYRPHNYYCIHMDAKTKDEDFDAITSITNCFENVHISPERVDVKWGGFGVLQAELSCLKLLWKYKKWKYFINLTGQEFPLKTNLEIVKILQTMKGANVVDGSYVWSQIRLRERWREVGEPPHGLVPMKGSTHVALNRDFVDFTLHDNRSLDLQAWLKKIIVSDESLFSTLNYNTALGIPGSFTGEPEEYPLHPFFLRYKNWEVDHGTWARKCEGMIVRWVCVLGVQDIWKALQGVGLFANKFHLDFQYVGYDCLEEIIHRRTWDQYMNNTPIDTRYYELLDHSRFQITKQ